MNTPATAQLQTFFAPPGRLRPERVSQQAHGFVGNVAGLLDGIPDLTMILNEERQHIFANKVSLMSEQGAGTRLALSFPRKIT